MERKPKPIFVQGAISPQKIADSIAAHGRQHEIGAHSIFLGQVRADQLENGHVTAIEYTAYEEMALEKMHAIREDVFARYPLTCMHVYHSLGTVAVGEICLFVFTSSAHRKAAMDACAELVERIKNELPIWGRELSDAGTDQWKTNTPA
jgi:molybdopterin synthase catalytic subunit